MRRAQHIVAALAAGALLVLGAPTAHAAPNFDYRGGCVFDTVNDTTPDGLLGGMNVWNGLVTVDVRAVSYDSNPSDQVPATPSPTTAISVNCELVINGGAPTVVLSASGTGFVANADQIQLTAASGSVVDLCDNVTVGGEHVRNCSTATQTEAVPEVVLGPVAAGLCPVLALLAPGVPGVAINSNGDTSMLGTTIWDCSSSFGAADAPVGDPDDAAPRANMVKGPGGKKKERFYPASTITMSQTLGGPVTYNLTGFTPAASAWTCTPDAQTMTSITCRAPAAPSGKYNVCGTVSVSAKSTAVGTVAATSSCAAGVFAASESTGPASSASSNSAQPDTDFPWTCAANPSGSLDWTVTCNVH